MGRYHKITTGARRLLHFNLPVKDYRDKYKVIILHANGKASSKKGFPTLKEVIASLVDVRHDMFMTGWKYKDVQWDYTSYDIADAWICLAAHCPHRFIFDGLSCMEKIEQSRVVSIGKCHYEKCGIEFEISRKRKAYCSAKCRKASQNMAAYYNTHQSFNRDCGFCKEPFTTSRADVVCCSAKCRQEYRKRTWREESTVIEDAIKDAMISLFETNGHKPVLASAVLNIVSVSHGLSRINSYLVQGNIKGKWRRTKPRYYIPTINGENNVQTP